MLFSSFHRSLSHICSFSFDRWFKSIYVFRISKTFPFRRKSSFPKIKNNRRERKKIIWDFQNGQKGNRREALVLFVALLDLCFFTCVVKLWLFNEWAVALNCGSFNVVWNNAGRCLKFPKKNLFPAALYTPNEVISC